MDFGKAVSYLFEDDEWQSKVGIASLLSIIPVLNFAVIGYEVSTVRSVMRGESRPLAKWSDVGALFMDGLWLSLARIIYVLPIFGLLIVPFASFFLLAFAAGGENERVSVWAPVALLICACGFLFIIGYALLFGLISPAITAQYVRHGTFSACFDVAAAGRFIRANLSDYLSTWLGVLAISVAINLVAGPVLAVVAFIPCLGQLAYILLLGAVAAFTLLVQGHLVGQLLRADLARAGTSQPPLP